MRQREVQEWQSPENDRDGHNRSKRIPNMGANPPLCNRICVRPGPLIFKLRHKGTWSRNSNYSDTSILWNNEIGIEFML